MCFPNGRTPSRSIHRLTNSNETNHSNLFAKMVPMSGTSSTLRLRGSWPFGQIATLPYFCQEVNGSDLRHSGTYLSGQRKRKIRLVISPLAVDRLSACLQSPAAC